MNRILGNWRALVTDNLDPTKSGRVKISIETLQLRNMWAEPAIQIGGSNIHGSYTIPRVGDKIFVFFDGGNINHPIYFAASPSQKDIPTYFAGGEDPLIKARNDRALTCSKFSEPTTNPTIEYPYGQGIKFPNGTLVVVDESSGQTKIGVYHPANSYQEWLDDGNHVGRVATDDYEIIMGNLFMYVGGNISKVVAGNYGIDIGGDFEQVVTGDSTYQTGGDLTEETAGNVTNKVGGNLTDQVVGNSVEQIGGDKNFLVTGAFNIQTNALAIIAQAINLMAATDINLQAALITLKGIVRLGPVGSVPVHVLGSSFCPYIGSPVVGGSTTVFGSP